MNPLIVSQDIYDPMSEELVLRNQGSAKCLHAEAGPSMLSSMLTKELEACSKRVMSFFKISQSLLLLVNTVKSSVKTGYFAVSIGRWSSWIGIP